MSEDNIPSETSMDSSPFPEQEAVLVPPALPAAEPVPPSNEVYEPPSSTMPPAKPRIAPSKLNQLFGIGLIVLGGLFLLGTVFNIRLGHLVWPFIFIVPGILLLFFALKTEGSVGEPMAIVSSIITMLGLIFLFQTATGYWATWAYIWSLIAPTSVGLGEIIYGTQKGQEYTVKTGKSLVKIGLSIFLVGFIFFEMLIGISGFGLGRLAWPLLLIFLGLFLLLRNLSLGGEK